MPNKEGSAERHRMVVEEVDIPEKPTIASEEKPVETTTPEIVDDAASVSSTDLIDEKSDSLPHENIQNKDKTVSPVFWILIPGIFILGAILGGFVFYQKGVNSVKVEATPTATPITQVTATPTPSASPSIDVSKFNVAVFNGSGILGEAAKAKDLLTAAGFNVGSTGNAATYDYTKTIIKAKASVDSTVIQKVKDSLSNNYVLGDTQTLASSSATDIQVVVGSSKAQ